MKSDLRLVLYLVVVLMVVAVATPKLLADVCEPIGAAGCQNNSVWLPGASCANYGGGGVLLGDVLLRER